MPKQCECVNPVYNATATLLTDTSTDDNPAELFTTTTTGLPVNVTAIGGQESFRGRSLESGIDYVVDTPYRSGITSRQQLQLTSGIFADRLLNIQYSHPVQKPNRPPTLELYCKELTT